MEDKKKDRPVLWSQQYMNGNAVSENDSDMVVDEKVRDGKNFRWKMFLHVTLCSAMFTIGISTGMTGPAFEDLMMITGVNYGMGSTFVTVYYVAVIVSSVLCGFLIDRYNKALTLAGAVLCFGCTDFLIPLCSLYWTMVLVFATKGVAHGVLAVGIFTTCGQLWAKSAKSAVYLHSMQLCVPMGGILAPLIVSPFLSCDQRNTPLVPTMMNQTSMYDREICDNSSTTSAVPFKDLGQANTYNISNEPANVTIYAKRANCGEQRLIIPYSISGVMSLTLVAFFVVIVCQKANTSATERTTNVRLDTQEQKQLASISSRILRLYLIGVLAILSDGMSNSFTLFFPTFLHNKMRWNKIISSDIMSVFWGVYTFARMIGICVSYHIQSSTYMFFDITAVIVSLLLMLVGTLCRVDVLMWISMALLAAGLSTLSPCLVSWIHTDILSRSGKHNSFYIIMCSLGNSLMPVVIGPLIEFDYMQLVYVLLTGSVIFMGHHTWLFLIARMKQNQNTHAETVLVLEKEIARMEDGGSMEELTSDGRDGRTL